MGKYAIPFLTDVAKNGATHELRTMVVRLLGELGEPDALDCLRTILETEGKSGHSLKLQMATANAIGRLGEYQAAQTLFGFITTNRFRLTDYGSSHKKCNM